MPADHPSCIFISDAIKNSEAVLNDDPCSEVSTFAEALIKLFNEGETYPPTPIPAAICMNAVESLSICAWFITGTVKTSATHVLSTLVHRMVWEQTIVLGMIGDAHFLEYVNILTFYAEPSFVVPDRISATRTWSLI